MIGSKRILDVGFLMLAIGVASMSAQLLQNRGAGAAGQSKVVCLYNSTSFLREGFGKLVLTDLEPAIQFCNYVVYGWAGIDPGTHKLKSLNENLDLETGKGHYRLITQLKRRYPATKFLLGVGGNADPNSAAYLETVETNEARTAFINSAYTLLKTYEFDGLDLAWQFPPNKPKKIRSAVGSYWYSFKKTIGAAGKPLDERAAEHKEGFTALVRELKNAFRHDQYVLSFTLLPNGNSSLFVDVPNVINNLDFVQLAAYDFLTPARNPNEADFTAPIYELNERNPEHNINAVVTYWTSHQAPPSKLLVCIPTFGRAWKLERGSTATGVPPILDIEDPAPADIQTKEAGLLSWPEVCGKLPNPSNQFLKGDLAPLRKVNDPTKRFGSYGYRLPDDDGNFGLWVAYEDKDTAANKAGYVVSKGLGGICIHELSLDDFRGSCEGEKFPILRAAKFRVQN